jgi:hypothetical protein
MGVEFVAKTRPSQTQGVPPNFSTLYLQRSTIFTLNELSESSRRADISEIPQVVVDADVVEHAAE